MIIKNKEEQGHNGNINNNNNNIENTSLVAKGALAHLLQRRTACKIQNGRQGGPKMADGVWKGVYP